MQEKKARSYTTAKTSTAKINIDNRDLSNRILNVAERNGASPSGKAAGFGPAIQRFESFRPSHYKKTCKMQVFLFM